MIQNEPECLVTFASMKQRDTFIYRQAFRVLGFVFLIALLPINTRAYPSDTEISELLKRAHTKTISDAYYLEQLYKKCESLEEVNRLAKILSSELIHGEYPELNTIAKARRIEFFGAHKNAFDLLKTVREENFDQRSHTVQSEYYRALGYIALNSGNPNLALKHYKKALSISQKSSNNELIQSNYVSVGVACNALQNPEDAMLFFLKAKAMETNGPNRNSLYIRLNMALTDANKGNLQAAKQQFHDALGIIRAQKDTYAEIRTLGNLADICIQQDSLEQAIQLLNASQELVLSTGQTLDLIFIKSKLATIYALQNNYEKAYKLQQEVNDIQGEYNTETDIAANILDFEASSELKETHKEKRALEAAKNHEATIKQITVFTLIISLMLTIFIFSQYLKIKRKNTLLMGHEKQRLPQQRMNQEKTEKIMAELEILMEKDEVYTTPDLTIDKLAKLLGTNRTYLSEAINVHSQMSFSQWLISRRINASKKMLADKKCNQYSIKGISEMVGFASISTFNTNFKRLTGVTPSYFRKSIQ